MPMFSHRVLSALAAVLLAASPLPAQAAASDVPSTIDRYLADAVEAGVPGIAVAVMRGGEVVHVGAAGTAGDGSPMTGDTLLRIESLSKSFTAAAVMQQVEQGRVGLDRPVRRYLPEFSVSDPRGARITVRHLLTHTSGMSDGTAPPLYRSDAATLEEAVARLGGATLAADPGTEFHYHNPNYHVLARMVEVVSGEDFGDYLEQRIFAPLGMHATQDTPMAAEHLPGMARGHTLAFGLAFPNRGIDYFTDGSGGVVSSARDMARWLWMNDNGGLSPTGERVLGEESVEEMHRPQGPEGADYGFGWYRAESAEGPPVRTSHSGAGSGFNAYQGLFTGSGYAVVVLTNHGAGLTAPQAGILGQNLLAELDAGIPPLTERGGAVRTDLVLSGLVLLTLVAVVSGVVRARRWAVRRRGGSVLVTAVCLVPLASVVVFVAGVPAFQLMATGRTAPWPLLFSVLPVGVVWLLLLGVGGAAVLVLRVGHCLGASTRLRAYAVRAPRARSR
ncbi:CubicO group peptidase (beta-lactamase class C family) [Nocardiopsis arvandica]|uniref:CubicO group peptidase (Beta-lactamase class C family) n=1 Tax=Nocardiopsis sinuspersici TaxID=501010 RepID=A0A7Y9XGG6_9ACTN|nr:serine hydrolase domain-containing protein [Nocardiopsis sinuspersici]NYH55404.1 CubicO group peptidase (beta-lactamase class C family) [Nocardiopsis sinuspersici]